MGQTRVDLQHLLEDLRDAYTGSLEETIVTEVVANALDSGARRIQIRLDSQAAAVTFVDDGCGMSRRELSRYHDIASSTKTRGEGIGFAGVGIKLGLLLCDEVVTESRRGQQHMATSWRLSSRHRAPWEWVPPPGQLEEQGTAVTLRLGNALSPLLDRSWLEVALRRHFEPLLDSWFEAILQPRYASGIAFSIDEHVVETQPGGDRGSAPLEIRMPRKRKPSGWGYLVRESHPLPEDRRGLAISTLGKVIRRGWDWLGLTPATPDHIGGLIEIPALAESLTLDKSDFLRSGQRGALWLAHRRVLQEVVRRQLEAWGDQRDLSEERRRRVARPVERDLERVLVDLAEEFPLVGSLVERHAGGQRRLPVGSGSGSEPHSPLFPQHAGPTVEPRVERESSDELRSEPATATAVAPEPVEPPPAAALLGTTGGSTRRRPGHYGLHIQYESRAGLPEVARLVETTVFVNEAHPAYRRAAESRSEGYHLALSVAMALAPLVSEPSEQRRFIETFLEHWGRALDKPGRSSRSRPRS